MEGLILQLCCNGIKDNYIDKKGNILTVSWKIILIVMEY